MCAYPWPGNVRELENAVYRSGVVAQGDTVLVKDLPREIMGLAPGGSAAPFAAKPALAVETPVASKTETAPAGSGLSVSPFAPVAVPPSLSLPEAYDLVYRLVRAGADANILEKIEAAMIDRALKETDGNHAKAAELLGITRATLRKRVDAIKS